MDRQTDDQRIPRELKIKSTLFKDTIAACATAFGNAGVAIIRISGNKSLKILKKIFSPKLSKLESRKLYYGKIINSKKEVIDEVLVSYFKAPKSYTAEDMVEIYCHGGFVATKRVLEKVLKEGARIARPGEFTERAFLAGRIDLTQAEAIADIIYAKTEKSQKIAEEQLAGSLKNEISKILNLILKVHSQLLLNIDFPDEDIPQITKKEIAFKILKPQKLLKEMLDGASLGTIYKEGLKVAIVGLPNAGKSSLLNALVKDSRAIVTDIPGTTRDILEEQIEIKGILIRLFDTAGITKTENKIEKEGILRSERAIKESHLLLVVIEKEKDLEKFLNLLRPEIKQVFKTKEIFLIKNKIDLNKGFKKIPAKGLNILKVFKTAAIKGIGIKNIEKEIFEKVKNKDTTEGVLITNLRQKNLLEITLKYLEEAQKLAEIGETEDKILQELDSAKNSLDKITGEVVVKEALDKIFSKFCIGK